MCYKTSNFKIVLEMSESLTTQQGKYMYTLCIQKALSPFFKKIYCSIAKCGQKHLEIQDLSIVQIYEKNDKLQDV